MANPRAPGKSRGALADWHLRSRLRMRHFLLLVALDDQRNMHRAATGVSMTQPAATRLLADLERLLGMPLFERSARGIAPNAYGESLVRHARMMLATLDHAREELNALSEGTSGKLSIGALLVAAPVLVPRAVARFKVQHPNHTILIREGTGTVLVPALRRGELDLVVGRLSSDVAGEGLDLEAFHSEPMRVVARVAHPLAKRGRLRLSGLAQAHWILPTPDAPFRRRLDAAFRQAGVEPPRCVVESLSVLVNATLVQETDMLSVMPRNVAERYAESGTLRMLPVELPLPSGPVGIITVTGRPLPAAAADFIQALREAAQSVAPSKAKRR